MDDWTLGNNDFVATEPVSTDFEVVFYGNSWPTLAQYGSVNSGLRNWQMRLKHSLVTRTDTGRPNSPPVPMASPLSKINHGSVSVIHINHMDIDPDTIMCRWARSYENECAGKSFFFRYSSSFFLKLFK